MTRIVATIFVALFVHTLAVPAFSQQPPPPGPRQRDERPFRGLFGGDPRRAQSLDLTFSTSGDYIDNMTPFQLAPGQIAADPRFSDSYFFSGANAGLSFTRRWNHVSLQASSSHNAFYYPDFHELTGVANSGTFGFSATSGQRFSFNASQSVAYSPYYGMGGMFGGDPASNPFIGNPLYGVSRRDTLQMFTNAGTSYALTRRTTLTANYTYQQMRFTTEALSFGNQNAGARLSRRMSRNVSLHAGYSRGWGDYGTLYIGGLPVTQHNIDAGVDYNRALSRRRQSSFGFNTGAVLYTTKLQKYYRLLANAHFDTEVGRSWSARAEYARGLNWLQGFSQPIYSDRVTLGATGYAGTRVQLSFSGGYSNGEPGLSGGAAGVDTYTGRSHVRVALNRFVGVSAQYLYYRYTFSADYPLPPGIPRKLDRQSVLLGVDLWLPLLR